MTSRSTDTGAHTCAITVMRFVVLRRASLVALALVMIFGAGCASSGGKGSGRAERKRTVLLTSADDIREGAEAAKSVQAEVGLLDAPELTAYIQGIGKKLLRGLPRRDFAYKFLIVDQMEPNAFALPGGYVYVSRGLLALVNNEDELACVIGHEIVHAAKRHSAQQQAVERYQSRLSLPFSRAATLASYGRAMEREADTLGQRLCAAAGYDPMGLSTFLRSLDQRERLLLGYPRRPTFLDTHPGSRERASTGSARASELRWQRDPLLGDVRERYLDRIDGMVIGDRPETGVFLENVFAHPGLGFEITFPRGWDLQNSSQAVGATSPRRDGVVYLTGDLAAGELSKVADEFAAKTMEEERGIRLTEKKRAVLGEIEAVRYRFEGNGIEAQMTFFPFAEGTWRIVGMAPTAAAKRHFSAMLVTTRSFGPVTPTHLAAIHTDRLKIVQARRGEDIASAGNRNGNTLDPSSTALLNGFLGNERFDGGELIKVIVRSDP